MKLLLAYISGRPDREDPYISLVPTGLCYLHACLRKAGYDAVLANFSGWSESEVASQIARLQPAMVALSQWTHNRHATLDVATLARRLVPAAMIVVGGGHATFQYEELLSRCPAVDCVVVGEGEETLRELADSLASGRPWQDVAGIAVRNGAGCKLTAPRAAITDLDSLPFSLLYLEHSMGIDHHLQPEFIVTARGCPAACRFCSSPGFWSRRVRFRSPAHIVSEIEFLRNQLGLIYFSLRDDTFTADRNRTIEFCRLLIQRKLHIIWNCQSRVSCLDHELLVWMKRAGCECVQLGIESGSPRILKQLGKTITPQQIEQAADMIRQVGIHLSVYLISDVPGETDADITATTRLMRRIKPDDGYVSPLAYYPGTELFEAAVREGRVSRELFLQKHDDALYVSATPGRNVPRLMAELERGSGASRKRFEQQKQKLGYCHATNVLAGEWYRQSGDYGAAEREFREIVGQEPDNVWGWYLLGELFAETGQIKQARDCYRKVLSLVPCHAPSREALAELS